MRVIDRERSSPRALLALLVAAAACLALGLAAREEADSDRDAWQRPEQVMDALALDAGSAVADVGCGDGYFTLHLASRVGRGGRVYAVDIDSEALETVRGKAEERDLPQVETVLGTEDDPRLPDEDLDAVLVVNAYHEMTEHDAMLAAFHRALRPGGRLAIIDKLDDPGERREAYRQRHSLPKSVVLEDARRHGFAFHSEPSGFVRPRRGGENWYFLVFEKPRAPESGPQEPSGGG